MPVARLRAASTITRIGTLSWRDVGDWQLRICYQHDLWTEKIGVCHDDPARPDCEDAAKGPVYWIAKVLLDRSGVALDYRVAC